MKKIINSILKFILPHGIFLIRQKIIDKKLLRIRQERIDNFKNSRHSKLIYDYEFCIQKLVMKNLDENQIRDGSIPEDSLIFLFRHIKVKLSKLKRINVLHIGNFVGISLSYISNAVLNIKPDSIILSIDPNISHRGIDNPRRYVYYLLNLFNFQKSNIVLDGYSLERNIGDDGVFYSSNKSDTSNYDAKDCFENILENLKKININFNLVVVDGNHDGDYLRRETNLIFDLLYDDGILVIDDVNKNWQEVSLVFQELSKQKRYSFIATDGRIGIIQKRK